jgi:hypothetical protein
MSPPSTEPEIPVLSNLFDGDVLHVCFNTAVQVMLALNLVQQLASDGVFGDESILGGMLRDNAVTIGVDLGYW